MSVPFGGDFFPTSTASLQNFFNLSKYILTKSESCFFQFILFNLLLIKTSHYIFFYVVLCYVSPLSYNHTLYIKNNCHSRSSVSLHLLPLVCFVLLGRSINFMTYMWVCFVHTQVCPCICGLVCTCVGYWLMSLSLLIILNFSSLHLFFIPSFPLSFLLWYCLY